MTIVEQFSDDFQNDFFYKITGSANALRLMSGSAHMIRFKADPGNIGTFFIGNDATHCFFPLDAGDDTGWGSAENTNRYGHINSSGSVDFLYYWLKL